MTNSPPPDPQSSQRDPLGFDEFIGIFVAFTTISAILFWSLSQRKEGFNLTGILTPSPSPSAQPTLTPITPEATSPTSELPLAPTVTPTESPDVLALAPYRTSIGQRTPLVVPRTTTPVIPVPIPAQQTPAPSQAINFVDVPQNYWARSFIDVLAARGIVTGFAGDYFRPDRPVTRAEFAALLQDAFDQKSGQTATRFKDIKSDFWAVRAVDSATQAGFLKGYPGNIFQPQQEIPRAQVLVALASGLNLPTVSSPKEVLRIYKDANQIPDYATEKIAAATQAGLVVNYPDPKSLNPNQNATRAEVAAIIHQALVHARKAEPIESQYLIAPRS
jgi:hypothetical protein